MSHMMQYSVKPLPKNLINVNVNVEIVLHICNSTTASIPESGISMIIDGWMARIRI